MFRENRSSARGLNAHLLFVGGFVFQMMWVTSSAWPQSSFARGARSQPPQPRNGAPLTCPGLLPSHATTPPFAKLGGNGNAAAAVPVWLLVRRCTRCFNGGGEYSTSTAKRCCISVGRNWDPRRESRCVSEFLFPKILLKTDWRF